MAYGPETHASNISYEVVMQHTPTGNLISMAVTLVKADGTLPTEAVRDQTFQSLLNKMGEVPNSTIVSAVKRGNYTSNVTVG